MRFINGIKKLISCLSIIAIISLQMAPVQAAMVTNHDLLVQVQHDISVAQILSILDRKDIQNRLVALGVNISSAKARIAQMNEAELAQLSQSLEQSPAGSGVLGLIVMVFIVLMITDMLGATDVFPFVKNINK